jgi:hypothetical protein
MTRIWRTVIAGTAAALFVLSGASAQPGANPQGTPAPQNTPTPPAPPASPTQGSQVAQPAQPAQPSPGTPGTAQEPVDEQELILATQTAEQWLALVDQGKYAESWALTSKYFQTNMPQDRWVQVLTSAHKTLGNVGKRTLAGREAKENIPGAPPGQYILVGYSTDFELKPGLVETVTLINEEGLWKVVGYSANPKPPVEGTQGQTPPNTETPQPAPTPPPSL